MDEKKKGNKITQLLAQADRELDQIFTRGTDTLAMAKARGILTEAYIAAQKLVIFDEEKIGDTETSSDE